MCNRLYLWRFSARLWRLWRGSPKGARRPAGKSPSMYREFLRVPGAICSRCVNMENAPWQPKAGEFDAD